MARISPRLSARGIVLLGLALACSPLLAQKQTVYQWKDANGVTHYADAPPATAHKKRDINTRSGTAIERVEEKKTSSNPNCDNARSNLARLRGQGEVGIDTDGDGKSDGNMNADQRANQIELNEAILKADCSAPAAAGNS